MIKLRNITKLYPLGSDVFTALKNINLEIQSGEFTAILGPSGSGKSTLMHIIGLLDQPTTGHVYIEGKDISTYSDDKISSLRNEFVGFVFQQFNLINKLTVFENILLPTIYARTEIAYAAPYAHELIDRFGLKDKERSYPNKISGGQQQRVAIARALIMKPRLILADEPTGNLDTKTGKEIMKLLRDLNRRGLTVVIVTHEKEIAGYTRRKIYIKDGELL